jgi:two-component system LytT family sensor kinase
VKIPASARFPIVIVLGAICLTLVFSAQDAMRASVNGFHTPLAQTLRINALDWIAWGLLTPFIALMARRFRLDASSGRIVRVAIWLAFAAACLIADALLTGVALYQFGIRIGPVTTSRPTLPVFLLHWLPVTLGWNLITFCMIAGGFHAALYYRDMRMRQLREADLEARLARAELNVLRMQVNPHFLFNALHTVSAVMMSDVPAAHSVLANIGDLLRWSMDHTAKPEVTLREELGFVERYVDIQRARFRDRLRADVDVDTTVLDTLVPSLMLQPLVENAIRHGIESHNGVGRISIRGVRDANSLVVTVRDTGRNEDERDRERIADEVRSSNGIGLGNVTARLEHLYGAGQSFSAGRDAAGGFAVIMRLPFHTQPLTASPNGASAL